MAKGQQVRYYSVPGREHPQGSSQRPEAPSDRESVFWKLLGHLAAVLGALVTIVYLAGALVLALRLASSGLTWQVVIGQLPRELLITVALTNVIIPALVVAALFVMVRLYRKPWSERYRLERWHETIRRKHPKVVVLDWLALAILLTVPTFVLVAQGKLHLGTLDAKVYVLVSFLTIAILLLLVMVLWTRFVAPLKDKKNYHSRKALGLSFILVAGAVIAPLVSLAAGSPMPNAKVCSKGGYENVGLFVGQTKDSIYLGESPPIGSPPLDQAHGRRLLSTPLDQTEQFFLGTKAKDAAETFCDHQLDIGSFMQVLEGLGSGELDTRIGSIYALGRIAETSPGEPYRQSIARIIVSYIRERSVWPGRCNMTAKPKSPDFKSLDQVYPVRSRLVPPLQDRAPDVFAATKVLAEWSPNIRKDVVIDLEGLDLRRAYLYFARLNQHVLLSDAHLELAKLYRADMRGATLIGAKLMGADLNHADLRDADLGGADLRDADLGGADLRGADLSGAIVDGRTSFEDVTQDATTKWPLGYEHETAKASGVSIEGRKVLVCTYFNKSG